MANKLRSLVVVLAAVGATSAAAVDVRQVYLPAREGVAVEPSHEAHVISDQYRDFNLSRGKAIWFVSEAPKPVTWLPEQEREILAVEAAERDQAERATWPVAAGLFPFNKVKPSRLDDLSPLAAKAKEGGLVIRVIGHADEVGSDSYNDALSRHRAEHVAALLAKLGVAKDLLVIEGRGKRDPVDPRDPAANRRVEIKLDRSVPADKKEGGAQ